MDTGQTDLVTSMDSGAQWALKASTLPVSLRSAPCSWLLFKLAWPCPQAAALRASPALSLSRRRHGPELASRGAVWLCVLRRLCARRGVLQVVPRAGLAQQEPLVSIAW